MNPAPSIVVFTSSAGAGYGLLFLLCVAGALGWLPVERWFGFVGFALALGLITLGLLASTFHLGHPERAWRALTQWRSSWLSREGVMAIVTYVPAVLFAAGWVIWQDVAGVFRFLGYATAIGAVVTVICTAMIYASLKPIRQWCNVWTVPLYLLFALATGALWLNAILAAFLIAAPWAAYLSLLTLLITWACKLLYWQNMAGITSPSSPESATGLGAIGTVRLLDPPHTEDNYLLREMGYRVARKHAVKLRGLSLLFGLVLAAALVVVGLNTGAGMAALAACAAAVSGSLGVLIERWLFFAEAKHSVTLYYGARHV